MRWPFNLGIINRNSRRRGALAAAAISAARRQRAFAHVVLVISERSRRRNVWRARSGRYKRRGESKMCQLKLRDANSIVTNVVITSPLSANIIIKICGAPAEGIKLIIIGAASEKPLGANTW